MNNGLQVYRSFQYGSQTIPYILVKKSRKTLGITVKPDKSLVVTSPEEKELQEIEKILVKKGKWILKQIRYFDSLPHQSFEKEYIPGESFRILGRQYRLKVYDGESSFVKVTHGMIHITVKNPKDKDGKYKVNLIRNTLENWYKEKAKEYLLKRAGKVSKRLKYLNLPVSTIEVKKMSKRWGSCTPKAKIILNSELIKVPCDCIDYVLIHEHLHLKIHSHNKKFYALLSTVLPGWEKVKDKLDRFEL